MDFIIKKILENSYDINMIIKRIMKYEKMNNKIMFLTLIDIICMYLMINKHENDIKTLKAQIEDIKSKGE